MIMVQINHFHDFPVVELEFTNTIKYSTDSETRPRRLAFSLRRDRDVWLSV